jgi:putative MATE family efflux protein
MSPTLRELPAGVAVWRVAWPMILLGWMRALVLVVDAWWVGRLGRLELTALASVAFGWWIVEQLMELAAVGTQTRVAQAVGAGAQATVGQLLGDGLALGALVSGLLLWQGEALASAYADALGLVVGDPERAEAVGLLGTFAGVSIGLMVQTVVGAVFRGLGDTRVSLVMSGLSLLITALLDPLLIWGWGPLPAMGLRGVAVATAAGGACGAVVGLVLLHARGVRTLGWPAWAAMAEIVRIGGPFTVTSVGFSLVYVAIGRQIVLFGGEHIAAVGVGHRIESFFFLAGVGVMAGCATMVGQHVGARDPEAAVRVALAAEAGTSRAMAAGTVLVMLGADLLVGLITEDPAIRASCATYLRFQCVVWVMMGWELVYEGAFAGVGRTVPSMVIGISGTLARIPAAWALARLGLGVYGIWAAIALSTLAKGALLRWWWHRRTWER